jgi:hypothetical protein
MEKPPGGRAAADRDRPGGRVFSAQVTEPRAVAAGMMRESRKAPEAGPGRRGEGLPGRLHKTLGGPAWRQNEREMVNTTSSRARSRYDVLPSPE